MALLRSAAARMLAWCCLLAVLGVPASESALGPPARAHFCYCCILTAFCCLSD